MYNVIYFVIFNVFVFFSHSMPQESMLQLSRTESKFFKKKTKMSLERLGFMKNLR